MESYKEFIQNILNARGRFACGDEYHERHHITPKCVGGTDEEENLIDLYAREHFIAHKLLAEENPNNNKLVYAWTMMSWAKREDQYRYEVTPEEYEDAKKALSLLSSQLGKERWSIPENNPMFGKHHSEEFKQKQSERAKARFQNPEERKRLSELAKNRSDEWHEKQRKSHIGLQAGDKNPMFGRKHTEESKRKNSESHKGMYVGEKHPMAKAVICLETMQIYGAVLIASNKTDICESSIRKCCYGEIKQAGGYQWKFIDDMTRKNGVVIPGAITLGMISKEDVVAQLKGE